MYESPIEVLYGQMQTKIENDLLVKCSQAVEYNINKDELIKALKYDREQYEKGYSDGLNADKWISVNDRLPENCIEVLVYDTDCGIVIGWYDKEIGDFAADFISPLDAVTHWQPLPEKPQD